MIHTLQAEIDDMLGQAKNSEEKSKRAMVDAARLADELRSEQDHATAESRGKRALDTQISELEMELSSVQTQTQESYKGFQRAERRVKELQFQQDEDRKNNDRMGELATRLQSKVKTYKQQIEEAEEIAALNLAKFRKAQQELEETDERAKLAEQSMGVLRMATPF